MIQPLGNASSYGVPAQTPSPGALQAQLARAEAQLQECVNCDSARTPQGQAKIQALTLQVQALRDRLEGARKAQDQAVPSPGSEPPSPLEGGSLDLRV